MFASATQFGLTQALGCIGERSTSMKKIRSLWRLLIALLAILICVLSIGGYQATRAINSYYFHTTTSALTLGNLFAGLVVLYLSIVALSGRWWPFKRRA